MTAAAGLRPRVAAARGAGVRRLALLGTGNVGAAFIARYRMLQARGLGLPRVAWLANSRTVLRVDAGLEEALAAAGAAPRREAALQGWAEAEALR
ncbi:MAG TPA: homoserine dehydrogenase, partial [Pseudoxanthomonas sp.]|nr:homoserine dehydrogenase [Pseudoxanthomonas sp.]